ncbi:hypothetical protein ECG_01517 [Echinococcus granulosus]|nr:hypothetical protein ECG_01517 [Echinococcus granulosus]
MKVKATRQIDEWDHSSPNELHPFTVFPNDYSSPEHLQSKVHPIYLETRRPSILATTASHQVQSCGCSCANFYYSQQPILVIKSLPPDGGYARIIAATTNSSTTIAAKSNIDKVRDTIIPETHHSQTRFPD